MINIGILGHGNLGRGVECAIRQNPDMKLQAIFTRRPPESVHPLTEGVPVYTVAQAAAFAAEIDVMILCGGSATDLPEQTPWAAGLFNVVDSFDNHGHIPEHFKKVDAAAREGGKLAVISAGWDPGLFSLQRLLSEVVLPEGSSTTFWGRGVSQGHSDAIRRIEGVLDARQYTIPIPDAQEAARNGKAGGLTAREKHLRECFVAVVPGADEAQIEREIVSMPDYFEPYRTVVHFLSLEQLRREHGEMPHGGTVIRSGETGADGARHSHVVEYKIELESNPEFTSSMLVAAARAAYRLSAAGETGCRSMLDIAPALFSPKSGEELRATLL